MLAGESFCVYCVWDDGRLRRTVVGEFRGFFLFAEARWEYGRKKWRDFGETFGVFSWDYFLSPVCSPLAYIDEGEGQDVGERERKGELIFMIQRNGAR